MVIDNLECSNESNAWLLQILHDRVDDLKKRFTYNYFEKIDYRTDEELSIIKWN